MMSSSTRLLARRAAARNPWTMGTQRLSSSSAMSSTLDDDDGALHMASLNSLFNPTDEHLTLRSMLRTFVAKEVCVYRYELRLPRRRGVLRTTNMILTLAALFDLDFFSFSRLSH